jgi:hypothetical protein
VPNQKERPLQLTSSFQIICVICVICGQMMNDLGSFPQMTQISQIADCGRTHRNDSLSSNKTSPSFTLSLHMAPAFAWWSGTRTSAVIFHINRLTFTESRTKVSGLITTFRLRSLKQRL